MGSEKNVIEIVHILASQLPEVLIQQVWQNQGICGFIKFLGESEVHQFWLIYAFLFLLYTYVICIYNYIIYKYTCIFYFLNLR